MALTGEYHGFNGRYRPTYWGAIPMPMVAPLSGCVVCGLISFLLLKMNASNKEFYLGCAGMGLSAICLYMTYKRFKAMNREELTKIELQANGLRKAQDVAV
ncbi:MAG: hypothetical protein ACPGF8_07600 [Opitutales bacterium]